MRHSEVNSIGIFRDSASQYYTIIRVIYYAVRNTVGATHISVTYISRLRRGVYRTYICPVINVRLINKKAICDETIIEVHWVTNKQVAAVSNHTVRLNNITNAKVANFVVYNTKVRRYIIADLYYIVIVV